MTGRRRPLEFLESTFPPETGLASSAVLRLQAGLEHLVQVVKVCDLGSPRFIVNSHSIFKSSHVSPLNPRECLLSTRSGLRKEENGRASWGSDL